MKLLLFCSLALLLFFSQASMIHWEEISSSDVGNAKSSVVRDLLEVAVGSVIQKGKFESTKAPLTGNFYSTDYDSIKYERKNASTVTYYKYNFLLTEDDGPSVVNATVIVSYNPSNSNFIVTNYHYNINYNENQERSDDGIEGGVGTETSIVDTRTLIGDGDEASLFGGYFDSIIAGHVERGTLPDDKYTVSHVYRASSSENDGSIEFNTEGFKYYSLWVKIRSSEGKYYLMEVVVDIPKENGELVLDNPRLVGSILLNNLNQQ